MKKTILAVALGLMTGTVSAASIYKDAEHGINVDAHGAVEMQYFQNYEFYDDNENAEIRIDDGELNFLTTVDIAEGVQAMGFVDLEVESGEAQNDELWVGLKIDHSTIRAGRLNTVWDDSGIGRDYELAMGDLNSFVDNTFIETFDEGDNTVRYDLELGNFYAAVAHNLKEAEGVIETSGTDGKVGMKFGKMDVRAFYQVLDRNNLADNAFDQKVTAYAIEAEYKHDAFGVSASVKDVEAELKNLNAKAGYQTVSASAEYTFEDMTVAGGVELLETTDEISGNDSQNVYINLTKQIHKNVKVYGEVGYTKVSPANDGEDDSSVAYVTGMEISF